MKRIVWLFTVLIACLVAPLLVRAQTAPPDVAQPDIAERFQPPRIRWQPCRENTELECGTLRLPVDYRKPGRDTFDMAFAPKLPTPAGASARCLPIPAVPATPASTISSAASPSPPRSSSGCASAST